MKLTRLAPILATALLTSCATTKTAADKKSPTSSPETVLITYHVIPGKEVEIKKILSRAWEIYRRERLVFASPHVIVEEKENGGARIVEILTWVSHDAPDHAPAAVKEIWKEMHALCEKRDGHNGLEGGEVELVSPQAQ